MLGGRIRGGCFEKVRGGGRFTGQWLKAAEGTVGGASVTATEPRGSCGCQQEPGGE
jgi:hypothetical protein